MLHHPVTVIAEEKAEIERDRIRMQRNVKEHEELERKQEETARQVNPPPPPLLWPIVQIRT